MANLTTMQGGGLYGGMHGGRMQRPSFVRPSMFGRVSAIPPPGIMDPNVFKDLTARVDLPPSRLVAPPEFENPPKAAALAVPLAIVALAFFALK